MFLRTIANILPYKDSFHFYLFISAIVRLWYKKKIRLTSVVIYISMIRKKIAQHLEPIKITKTEANYQCLLLEMMSKLVNQQRQSNRLLKQMVGESDSEHPSISIRSPRRHIFQSLQKSMPVGMPSVHKETEIDSNQMMFDNLSEIEHKHAENHFESYSEKAEASKQAKSHVEKRQFLKKSETPLNKEELEKKEEPQEKALVVEKSQSIEKVAKGIQDLAQILKRIEISLAANLIAKQGRELQRAKSKHDKSKSNLREGDELHCAQNKKKEENFLENGFNFNAPDKKENKDNKDKKPENLKKVKGKNQKKDRLSAFDTFKIEKYLQSKQNLIKPILTLNTENEERKNYSILSQFLPYSDKRQIKIKIPIVQVMEYYQIKQVNNEQQASLLTKHWLGNVYRATASICWNLLSSHELSFEQTKILFTENIIYNLIQYMKTIKVFENNGNQVNRCRLVEDINHTSVKILEYLCNQYPQTKVEDPNIALRNEIPSIDNKGEAEYDLISKISQAKQVSFRRKENGDYTQQIMKTINYMIERSNQEFQRFKDIFGGIFGQIFLPAQKRRTVVKEQETHEDQLYYEKVKSYTKYAIGQKINKNTPKYSQEQIQNGIFFVKSPSILRVITKWVEQLDEIITNPERQIKNTQNQFKDHNGMSLYLYAQIKNGLFKKIKEGQEFFENKIKHIKQQCYHMEVLLALQLFTTDQTQKFITREQTSVGKYCNYLKSAISSYICSELNEAIHFLLTLPSKVDQTKIGITDHFYQEESKKDLNNLNLVRFKLFDLLRCKCISKETEIVYLIRRLNQKNNDPNDPFKIIRIKDRLSNGTRDILINAQIGKGLVCEIQLAVVSNIDKKQELLDQFNHFLYELKRAKLGPISENAAIWSTLEQRSVYFESLIQAQQKEAKHGEAPHLCINVEKSENICVKRFTRPIICVSCNRFYEIPRTCLHNISCERCKKTYCGQCHFVHMSPPQRKQYLFQKIFRPFFPYLNQYTSFDKPLPKFGFLVRKYFLKKQLAFFKILTKSTEQLTEKGKVDIEFIISVVEGGKIINESANEIPMQADVKNGELLLKEKRYREELGKYIIYSIDVSKDLEKKTLSLSEIFETFQKQKLRYINILKQPAYIEDMKIIKRSKQIKKESKEFKNILSPETMITYLKLDKTVIIAQLEIEEKQLHAELVQYLNVTKLRNYAVEKSFAVQMDFRQMTTEMSLIQKEEMKYFTKQLYENFSRRVTKLYLNSGRIKQITFLYSFPNIKVLYLSSNCINSLAGVQNLTYLEYICFDKNNIDSLEPLANLLNLIQVSGSENKIASLNGLQNLTKIGILTLYKNEITEINYLENLKVKELSLNNNPIKKIENLNHMKDSLEELYIGGTQITNLEQILFFTGLKKLSLDALKLTKFDPAILKGLEFLTYLSLADNCIEKVENLEAQTSELIQLNMKNNRLTQISGFDSFNKLQTLKLQKNFITNVIGVKGVEHLKALHLEQNPLEDCTDLYSMDSNIQFFYSKVEDNVDPLYAPKPQFYEKYELYEKHKGASSSGSNEDSQVDQE